MTVTVSRLIWAAHTNACTFGVGDTRRSADADYHHRHPDILSKQTPPDLRHSPILIPRDLAAEGRDAVAGYVHSHLLRQYMTREATP